MIELDFVDEPPAPKRGKRSPDAEEPRFRLELVREEPPPVYIAPDSHRPHGTHKKYVLERCKCEPCRRANREYELGRQRAMRRPDEAWLPYVPADRARTHLLELRANGVGFKTAAELAGIAPSVVGKILYGDPRRGMAPSRRIRPATEAKLLSVTVERARRELTGNQHVPAGPTWELIEDLVARGFPKSWIAKRVVSPRAHSLQIRSDVVRASTARKIEQLHRRLEGVTGPGRRSRWSK